MLSVRLNRSPRNNGTGALVEIAEVPRPEIVAPTDAVLMVTTTAIGPWDIAAAARAGNAVSTPGTQFVGIVVEIGEAVTSVNIDDLVVARSVVPTGDNGTLQIFGSGNLDGGHAEYVRVPHADETLTRTTAASEERSVFAGGAAAQGIAAAEEALKLAADKPVLVIGCDAAGLTALAWLKHRRGKGNISLVLEPHAAKLAAGKAYGAAPVEAGDIASHAPAIVIITAGMAIPELPARTAAISTEPGSSEHALPWPTLEQVRRAEMAIRLRQVDLTPLVSTVLPLDEAAEAYRVAIDAPPGVRSVLLKP
jgi:threonine dehydrogenase-like Zn-dependent dehydrogenase